MQKLLDVLPGTGFRNNITAIRLITTMWMPRFHKSNILASLRRSTAAVVIGATMLTSGLYGSMSVAGSLFENETPTEEAQELVEEFDGSFAETLKEVERNAKELGELKEMTPEDARKRAEATAENLRELLRQVEPGGNVEEAVRGSLNWMEQAQEAVRQDTTMSPSDRQQAEQLWAEEIAKMLETKSRLDTLKGTLEAELGNLSGTMTFLMNLEMINTARAMNQAAARITQALNEALDALRQQRPDSSPSS